MKPVPQTQQRTAPPPQQTALQPRGKNPYEPQSNLSLQSFTYVPSFRIPRTIFVVQRPDSTACLPNSIEWLPQRGVIRLCVRINPCFWNKHHIVIDRALSGVHFAKWIRDWDRITLCIHERQRSEDRRLNPFTLKERHIFTKRCLYPWFVAGVKKFLITPAHQNVC